MWGLSQPSHEKADVLSPYSLKFPKVTKATVISMGLEAVTTRHQSRRQLREISICFARIAFH